MRSHEAANFSFLHKETVYMRLVLVFFFFLFSELLPVILQKNNYEQMKRYCWAAISICLSESGSIVVSLCYMAFSTSTNVSLCI